MKKTPKPKLFYQDPEEAAEDLRRGITAFQDRTTVDYIEVLVVAWLLRQVDPIHLKEVGELMKVFGLEVGRSAQGMLIIKEHTPE